jgi:hypothetical protein
MLPSTYLWTAMSLLIATCTAGCADGPAVGDVRGTVTVNGQPLKEGSIRFIPVAGDTPASGGTIRDGSFEAKVPVAKQRVEIVANVIDEDKTPPNATADQIVMKKVVPDRYGAGSELTLDVKPGVNEPVYNLTDP